jgi:uncharacterized protein (TIGR02391 family)
MPDPTVEAIASVLGDTNAGLTGSEMGRLLRQCRIGDPQPAMTKRHRLALALSTQQNLDGTGNCIVHFIKTTMSPVRFVGRSDAFEAMRQDLNEVLAFCGLSLREDGEIVTATAARTLSEAAQRTNRLRKEMHRRGVHAEVLKYCSEELLADDCFNAVFEAVKGMAQRIRDLTGLTDDGADLVQEAFSLGKSGMPKYAFNSLRSVSEQSEQKGLVNLMCGVFGTFRNPSAHAPKVKWHVSESDALDLLSTLSLLHRRIDLAVATGA